MIHIETDSFNLEVGKRIFHARKDLGLTRAELGKKVNLHESTIKRYEDGDIKSLSIEKLEIFADALNISPSYLMGWQNETITTIAAHHEGEHWTDDELEEIENFKRYVLSKRKGEK